MICCLGTKPTVYTHTLENSTLREVVAFGVLVFGFLVMRYELKPIESTKVREFQVHTVLCLLSL